MSYDGRQAYALEKMLVGFTHMYPSLYCIYPRIAGFNMLDYGTIFHTTNESR
jgi:hypothetical protein